jgi:hypothetical protein
MREVDRLVDFDTVNLQYREYQISPDYSSDSPW